MTTLSVRLPDSLHKFVKEVAGQDHVSINPFIASALAEKVAALATATYWRERAKRAAATKFMAALAAVPDLSPEDFDR